jgi:hypothetical protein
VEPTFGRPIVICPECGKGFLVHGDCLICDRPLIARGPAAPMLKPPLVPQTPAPRPDPELVTAR